MRGSASALIHRAFAEQDTRWQSLPLMLAAAVV
jgi:hypothetical protein